MILKKNVPASVFVFALCLIVSSFVLLPNQARAATGAWNQVGSVELPAYWTSNTSLAISSDDTPYVAYQDVDNSNEATVVKFDGLTSTWVPVGSVGFSAGDASDFSLAFSSDDIPYVAYVDDANNDKITVMKFDGNSWIPVGSVGFSPGRASGISLAFSSDGTPYVAYIDHLYYRNKPTVMKFDGNSWVLVGSANFSLGKVNGISFAFSSDDTPYVAYLDRDNSNETTVMKFDGNSWVLVGSANFSTGWTNYISLAFSSDDIPYVAYADDNKTTVMKFDSSAWVPVGPVGFSSESGGGKLAFSSDNTPYVVYADLDNYNKATAMKFDGSSWIPVGQAGFSAGSARNISLAISSDDIPYVVYTNGNSTEKYATIMKLIFDPIITSYSGNFSELESNNGSVTGSRVITLANDTFINANSTLTLNTHYTISPMPSGLTPVMTINSDGTIAILTFTGNATDSLLSDSISNLTITFLDGAFTDTATASGVINYTNNQGSITFHDDFWVPVDSVGISESLGGISFSVSTDNIPYVAYSDNVNNSGKATVMKFDGSSWIPVGQAGFSESYISVSQGYSDLLISPDNIPYVAYVDGMSGKINVMKFDGTSWIPVGQAGFSAQWSNGLSLAFSSDGTPYVAYTDSANNYKATVMKFDGSSWIPVGQAGFSATGVYNISFAISPDNTPYVAYSDNANSSKATVMKFDGSSWILVGPAGFSEGWVSSGLAYLDLSISPDNTLYIAYQDGANNQKATVMKFDGSSWILVGSAGFSAGIVEYITIDISSDGIPYVAYSDFANNNKATVMKFDGNSWVSVGLIEFSTGEADYTSLVFSLNDTLYVAYVDDTNNNKAIIMKYVKPISIPTLISSTPTSITQTGATLKGEVTNNGGEDLSELGFQIGLDNSYLMATGTVEMEEATGTFSYDLSNLDCNTTYHYRAYATNSAGTSYGEDMTFTTSACDVVDDEDDNDTKRHSRVIGSINPSTLLGKKSENIVNTNPEIKNPITTPSFSMIYTRLLKQGTRGDDIKQIQTYLTSKGYILGLPDGIFGPKTKQAVIAFQKANGLTPDGLIGKLTIAKMNELK